MHIDAQVNLDLFNEAITIMQSDGNKYDIERKLRDCLIISKQPLKINDERFRQALSESYNDTDSQSYIRTDTGEILRDYTNELIESLPEGAELIPLPTFNWDCLYWWDKYTPDSPISVCAWVSSDIANEDGERDNYPTFNEFANTTCAWGPNLVDEWQDYMREKFPDVDIEDKYNNALAMFEDHLIDEWMDALNHRNFDMGFWMVRNTKSIETVRSEWYSIKGEYQIVWDMEHLPL